MDKAERRENQRRADRYRPRGNPKFLQVLMQEELKRLQQKIQGVKS